MTNICNGISILNMSVEEFEELIYSKDLMEVQILIDEIKAIINHFYVTKYKVDGKSFCSHNLRDVRNDRIGGTTHEFTDTYVSRKNMPKLKDLNFENNRLVQALYFLEMLKEAQKAYEQEKYADLMNSYDSYLNLLNIVEEEQPKFKTI